MTDNDLETQANVAITLDEKVVDRVRRALAEVLDRGSGDLYIQDQIDNRIRTDVTRMLQNDYATREMIRTIVKQVMIEQMNKY